MFVDVLKLRKWYASAVGKTVVKLLLPTLKNMLPEAMVPEGRILALGYGIPFAALWPQGVEPVLAMPTQMGVVPHPAADGTNQTCMVWEAELPFDDGVFEVIFLSHVLEFSGEVEKMLDECWRVLRPNGVLVLMAPNRSGAWCRREISPFARGRPFSLGQISGLLHQAGFSICDSQTAVFMPPSTNRFVLKYARWFEKYLGALGAPVGGVILVQVRKDVVKGSPVRVVSAFSRRMLPAAVRGVCSVRIAAGAQPNKPKPAFPEGLIFPAGTRPR